MTLRLILLVLSLVFLVSHESMAQQNDASTTQVPDTSIPQGDASAADIVDAAEFADFDAAAVNPDVPTDAGSNIGDTQKGDTKTATFSDAQIEFQPEKLTTGDVLKLRIRKVSAPQNDVALDKHEFEGFEVLDTQSSHALLPSGKLNEWVFEIELLATRPGEHELGGLPLRILDAKGDVTREFTKPHQMRVFALTGNEPNAKVKPPTAPVSVEEDDPRPRYAGYFLLLIAFGALLMHLFNKFRRRFRPAPPPPPPRPPWEVALESLRRLRRSKATEIDSGSGDKWLESLSFTVRRYLGASLAFDGLESTSEEIHAVLKKTPLPHVPTSEVMLFLQDSDLLKFTDMAIDIDKADALLLEAERIVRASTPVDTASASHKPTNETQSNAPENGATS